MRIIRNFILLLLFGIISISAVNAQSIKKLEKLSEKEKFEKLIKKANKRIKKGEYDAYSYYYLTKGYLFYATASEDKIDERKFYQATRKYMRFSRLRDSTFLNNDIDSIVQHLGHTVVEELSERKKRRKKYYAGFLADQFNDTLAIYNELFVDKSVPAETPGEEEEIDDTAEAYASANKIAREKKKIRYSIPEIIPPGSSIIKTAEGAMGTPWVWAGVTPGKGFDCSGFVIWAYKNYGYELPHKTKMLATIGQYVVPDKVQPGDLVCFGSNSYSPKSVWHIGLVHSVEDNQVNILHCSTSIGVSIASVTDGYWSGVDHFFVRITE